MHPPADRPNTPDHLDGHLLPGWYSPEGRRDIERFWDGRSWTELVRSAPMLADYLGPIEPLLAALLDDEHSATLDQQPHG